MDQNPLRLLFINRYVAKYFRTMRCSSGLFQDNGYFAHYDPDLHNFKLISVTFLKNKLYAFFDIQSWLKSIFRFLRCSDFFWITCFPRYQNLTVNIFQPLYFRWADKLGYK